MWKNRKNNVSGRRKHMVIEFFTREVYGVERHYVKDKAIAHRFSQLLNKKTVSKLDLSLLSSLGLEFKEVIK
jgi:Mn-dependent DtxR family transcriptional regulator